MQQDNSKLPIHHKFLTTVGIDIYEEARVHGASPKGALLVLAQATLESGWGQAALKYGDFNLFGVMGTPSKRKTSHGNVKDYSNLGEYKGAVLDFFEKIERTWPNYKDLIKKNNFSSTDVDSALNTGDYFPTDSERLNGKYAYNADLDADGKNKYGKMLIKQMSYVKNRLIESIDYQITQNNIQIDMIDYTLSTIGVLSNNGKSELIKQRQTLINYNYRLTLVRIQINEVN
jgi:hypothetical protein